MQQTSIQIDDSVVVKNILGNDRAIHALGNGLSMDGITLDTPPKLLENQKYMWLEFGLPEGGARIKALGEITEKNKFSIKVRFKHMFPDQKETLAAYLDTKVSMN